MVLATCLIRHGPVIGGLGCMISYKANMGFQCLSLKSSTRCAKICTSVFRTDLTELGALFIMLYSEQEELENSKDNQPFILVG